MKKKLLIDSYGEEGPLSIPVSKLPAVEIVHYCQTTSFLFEVIGDLNVGERFVWPCLCVVSIFILKIVFTSGFSLGREN